MADRAQPADMAVDRHVVGRIGEDEIGPLVLPSALEARGSPRVAAKQAMAPEEPEIAATRDR